MYIVKYTENSDSACKSEVELFKTQNEAVDFMSTAYNKSLVIFGKDRFATSEDENDPDKPWSFINMQGAHIQDGIDRYDWEIIEDERFVAASEAGKPQGALYALIGCEKDGDNGNFMPFATHIFMSKQAAKKELRKNYFRLLKEYGLENNAACDSEGSSIPGGYIESDGMSATLYDNTENAFGCLEEVAFLAIHTVEDVQ